MLDLDKTLEMMVFNPSSHTRLQPHQDGKDVRSTLLSLHCLVLPPPYSGCSELFFLNLYATLNVQSSWM